jgi:hypothetical protein
MKKNIYKSLSLAVLTLFAAACQNNEDFGSAYDNDPNAVIVNASIGARTQTRVSTESATVDKWDSGDAFSVKGGATNKTATYTYDGSAWTVGSDYLTWNSTGTNDFTAWYPSTASYTVFILPPNQTAGISSADWMTASATGVSKPGNKQLGLQFSHKLTKVIVNVTEYGSEFGGNVPTIEAVTFSLPSNPSSTGATLAMGYYVYPFESTQNGKPCYTGIVLPGTYTSGAPFLGMRVTPAGSTTYQELKVVVPDALVTTGLEAGKVYTFNLKVGKDAVDNTIKIVNMSVATWNEGTMANGEATEKEEGYVIGDLYPDDENPVGVVFEVNGKSGKVVGFEETNLLAWGPQVAVGTGDTDGAANMAIIQAIEGWEASYPAFKWCADRAAVDGKNWYLPAVKEVQALVSNITAVNAVIKALGKSEIAGYWWTSSEPEDKTKAANQAMVSGATISHTMMQPKTNKTSPSIRVRAILAF